MADEVFILRSDCTGESNCYTSLSSFASAEAEDLTDAGYGYDNKVLEVYNDWPSGLGGGSTFRNSTGWTTNDSHQLIIRAASGEGHGGDPSSGVHWDGTGTYCLRCVDIEMQFIEFRVSGSYWPHVGYSGHFIADRCFFQDGGDFELFGNGESTFRSCVIDKNNGARLANANSPHKFHNCTIYDVNDYPVKYVQVINCVEYNTSGWLTGLDNPANSTNLASEDTTASRYSNGVTSYTASSEFTDAANGDFTLKTGTQLDDAGSSSTTATHDITGTAFSGTYPIGAFLLESGGGDVAFSGVGSAGTSAGAGQTGQLALGRSLTGDAGTGAGAGQAGVGTFGTSIPFIGEGAAGTATGAGEAGQLITGIALEGDAGAATGAGQVGQGQFGGAFSGQGSAGVGSGVGRSGILAAGHVLNGGAGAASGSGQTGAAIIGAAFIGEGQAGTATGAGQAGQLTAGVDGAFRGEGAEGTGTGEGSIGHLVLGFILEGNAGTGTGAGYAGSILTDDGVVSEWMTASLRMINAAYRLGDPARYLPTAGGTLDVTVVHTQDQIDVLSEAGLGVRAADHLVFVRKNEVASPAVGDQVIEYGKSFTVERVEQYNEHEWVLNVRV